MNIRKLARPAAALLAAAALMAGIPELRMEAQAAFPEYLKSVTYFGDAWPINYWGTEDDNMGANFARIKADGFNSIILVIPWREFQPGDMGNMYNEAAFAKLDQVMKCADDHGTYGDAADRLLLGYSGEASLPERYAGVVQDGSNDRKMWIDYCKTIYEPGIRLRELSGWIYYLGGLLGLYVQTWTGISLEPSVSVWHPDADIRII